MCTCPNYMLPIGTHINKDGLEKVTYQFIGHHQFKKMTRFFQDNLMSFVEVPCQKCLECRVQYARSWADRCVLEAKQYKHNYFVTLTYDDYFLPNKNSLEPKDVQLFMKRLRKKFKGLKIRFLMSGEYGDISFRPHYHLLLFNLPLTDLSYQFERREVVDIDLKTGKPILGPYLKYNLTGNKKDMMFSRTIYDLWNMGNISVQNFNYDTAAYVSQYVTKKANPNNDKLYEELGIYPEFIRMSNRPGIGAQYFEDKDDGSLHLSKMIIPQDGEAHLSSVPRYFDKLFIKKYGDSAFDSIRIKRNRQKLRSIKSILNDSKMAKDRQNELRAYNLKKRQHLRDSI